MNIQGSFRQPARRSGQGTVSGWLIAILLLLTVLLFFKMMGGLSSPLHDPDSKAREITPRGDLAEDEQTQIEIYRQASLSVVHIRSASIQQDRYTRNLLEIQKGTGSGFIWDTDGHIVTNFHVIQGAQVAHITLADNSTWDAELVDYDADHDLAVLKINAPANLLFKIAIGTSHDLQVGQKAFAVGNPFGLKTSFSTGVVSGLERVIKSVTNQPIMNVIQTDAAINPGNSGGPLLDSAGRLIGVNTAIVSPSGTFAGVGFAVPVDTVNTIVPLLISGRRSERPGLGIVFWPAPFVREQKKRGNLPRTGVLVKSLIANGAAEKVGMQATQTSRDGRSRVLGDLIIGFEGKNVENYLDLFKVLSKHKVGETVTITVIRGREKIDIPLKLQALPTVQQ